MPAISAAEELHRLEWRVQALEEDCAHLGYSELKKTYLLHFTLDVAQIGYVYELEDTGNHSNASGASHFLRSSAMMEHHFVTPNFISLTFSVIGR